MRMLVAALCGGLFGAGLYLSGMTDITKVIGWLDVFGAWDPTLAFVLGGAILPMAVAWRVFTRPLLGGDAPALLNDKADLGLVAGSVLFGLGWGLAGLCPGPAVASLSFGGWQGLVFFGAMVAGMLAAPKVRRRVDALTAGG